MAYKIERGAKVPTDVKEFLHTYRASVNLGQVEQRYRSAPFNYSFNTSDFREYNQQVETYYQQIVELRLAEEDFTKLVEDAEYVEDIRRKYGPDIMRYVEDATRTNNAAWQEQRIRKANPGVQLAWEKYQMMLKIAGG